MRTYPMLPVWNGILHGEERPYDPSGWLLEVTDEATHRWILAQDGDGSRYWKFYGLTPHATADRG